ncbi:DUF1294 domain-containing protein [Porphyromonadaceae bacterium W3.11]|nr:DUF1294 domain-containing protein [Porphyromonadaceae bacterium W3.11]
MYDKLLYYLIIINLLTFIIFGVDKWRAKAGKWRISEINLLLLVVMGGGIGAVLGMRVWRHKTKHKKFTLGVPIILLIQVLVYILLQN